MMSIGLNDGIFGGHQTRPNDTKAKPLDADPHGVTVLALRPTHEAQL